MWVLVLQRILLDALLRIIYFPVWWYTGGMKHISSYCANLLRTGNDYMAPGLWLKNIFVPMFGQSDWQGRIMSVFMRFINIIGRSIGLLFWMLIVFIIFIFWIIWPVFVVYMLIISF